MIVIKNVILPLSEVKREGSLYFPGDVYAALGLMQGSFTTFKGDVP